MQKITVLCVGKLKEAFYEQAVKEYEKRLSRCCKLELLELPEQRLGDEPSEAEIRQALKKEAALVEQRLPKGGALIAMCIEGQEMSSVALSQKMQQLAARGASQLTFLIGSSFGLDEDLKKKADLRLSMSPMTFPHHLARVMLLDYLIGAMKRAGKLPANAAALKTIVTTEMARAVAEANGLDCYDTFTGFKFMAEKMNELEGAGKNTVIFSYEESYGYMIGHYVRDKDAVTASLLLTEMAAWYYSQGMTLFDALNALFEKYGWYGEKTHNLVMPGLDGAEKMAALMKSLRETPPSEIAGVKVATYKDYSDGTARDAASGEVTKIALSGSNVLRFELCDGTHIVVRPSGTEPKIKVYILTKGSDAQERDANLAKYSAWVNTLA